MATCSESRPQNRKRRYAEADPSQEIPSLRPSKKSKLTQKHHSASRFPSPEFWDSLSKVWLTPRALRELDRRNRLQGRVRTRVLVQAPTQQFTSRNDLPRFARHGGPKLSDLRGYPEPKDINRARTMSSRRSGPSDRSSRSTRSRRSKSSKPSNASTSRTSNTSGRRSSAYDADFEQHLVDNGVYPEGYEYPNNRQTPEPDNVDEMRRGLAASRPSLSPSQFTNSDFRNFKRANARVIDEGEVMRDVLPVVYGNADIAHKENLLFTRLESITNKLTVDAKPDFYDGAPAESLDEQVRTELGRYIVPTLHRTAPVAPNFFLEAKAPKGGADVAKRQITHNLSLGARGMRELQSYAADEPVYDDNAYTLGATYQAGNLNMYATHVTTSGPGGSPEYHMTQIGGWNTVGDPDSYRRGAAALRNGRDMMKKYRDQFISTANGRVRSIKAARSTLDSSNYSGLSHTPNTYLGEESLTSDELAASSFYADEEPELSEDELAGQSSHHVASSFPYPTTASFLYHIEEPKTSDDFATSFSHPAATSFSYPAKSDYDGLLNISEESDISTDELAKPTSKSVPSKRPLNGLERKHISKASRTLHQAAASQLTGSSGYQALPSKYQLGSTIPRYLSASTAQYKRSLPSTTPSSNRVGGEDKQDDNDYEYEDEEEEEEVDEDYRAVSLSAHIHLGAMSSSSKTQRERRDIPSRRTGRR